MSGRKHLLARTLLQGSTNKTPLAHNISWKFPAFWKKWFFCVWQCQMVFSNVPLLSTFLMVFAANIWRSGVVRNSWAVWIIFSLFIMKRCPFHYRGLESKSRKSRNTWSNRQIWPWNTKWSRAKANRVLPREHTGHNKHPLPTTQKKTTHGHHQMLNTKIRLIIFFAAKNGDALYSQQKQDWELTLAQIINSLPPNSDLNWRK